MHLTTGNLAKAMARLDNDALTEWLIASIHEATDPLADMPSLQLEQIAAGRAKPPAGRSWLTPPMARLQLRLRAVLAEQEAKH